MVFGGSPSGGNQPTCERLGKTCMTMPLASAVSGGVADTPQKPTGDGSIVVLRRIGKRDRLHPGCDGRSMIRRQANAVSTRAMAFAVGSGLSRGKRGQCRASCHAPCRHFRAADLRGVGSIGEAPALRGLPWRAPRRVRGSPRLPWRAQVRRSLFVYKKGIAHEAAEFLEQRINF